MKIASTDIDPAGLVYFGSYLYFLARAEDGFFRFVGHSLPDLEKEFNVKLFRKEINCRYRSAARYDDLLESRIWMSKVSNSTATYQFEILKKGEGSVCAEGNVSLVALSKPGLQEIGMPDTLLHILQSVMSSSP